MYILGAGPKSQATKPTAKGGRGQGQSKIPQTRRWSWTAMTAVDVRVMYKCIKLSSRKTEMGHIMYIIG